MKNQPSFFDDQRMTFQEALDLTAQTLNAYAVKYRHWAIAYSGGKDSSALVTAVIHLIEIGAVQRPDSLTVLYSDTRQEIPPLHIGALETLKFIRTRGYAARVVLPKLDDRYFVYMLGRGVPPPNNNTLRWCTAQLKIEPMQAALKELRDQAGQKFLMLTGIRIGESAVRDARIALSCGRSRSFSGSAGTI